MLYTLCYKNLLDGARDRCRDIQFILSRMVSVVDTRK